MQEPRGRHKYDITMANLDYSGGVINSPVWISIYGYRIELDKDQWHVVSHIVLRHMLIGAGQRPETQIDNPNEPYEIPTAPIDEWATRLLVALRKDPKKTYAMVPFYSRINWRNYACLATWFGWLQPTAREEFLRDLESGATSRWIPAVQSAMRLCPQSIIQDPTLDSGLATLEVDPDTFHTHDPMIVAYPKYDPDFDRPNIIHNDANQSLPTGSSSLAPPTLSSLPTNLLCTPFPLCLFGPAGSEASVPIPSAGASPEYPARATYGTGPGTGTESPPTAGTSKTAWYVAGGVALALVGLLSYAATKRS